MTSVAAIEQIPPSARHLRLRAAQAICSLATLNVRLRVTDADPLAKVGLCSAGNSKRMIDRKRVRTVSNRRRASGVI